VWLDGEDVVISMAVRQAATLGRWFMGPIQALPWKSLAMGFDATRERRGDRNSDLVERQRGSALRWHMREDGGEDTVIRMAARQAGCDATRERGGDGDGDLAERQRTSAFWRHTREDGGEDTGEDTGGDSGEDTREEDKEERRRGRSTTTTCRVDEDARPVGESSRSVVDDDGEDGTHGRSVGESIASLRRGEVLLGVAADTVAPRIVEFGCADSSLGAPRVDALNTGAGPSPASHTCDTAPRVGCWLGAARVDALGAGAAIRAVEHGVDAAAGDAAGEGARKGDLAP
jgi:hypothetical protein